MAQRKHLALTEEQRKFIDKALSGKNIMLDGAAGSGKRTAVKELCAQIPVKHRVLYFTNSRFFKNEVEVDIKNSNVSVEYYSGYAFRELRTIGIYGDPEDLVGMFAKVNPNIKGFDYLIIAEFEDLTQDASKMLEVIKNRNPNVKIIAYGDVTHKVFEAGVFNARDFMEAFLDNYEKVDFKNCYTVSSIDKDLTDKEDADINTEKAETASGETSVDTKKEKRKPLKSGGQAKEDLDAENLTEKWIAVIDTEINRNDEVMSVGLVVADAATFDKKEEKYYIIEPEHTIGGEHSKSLRINELVNVSTTSRKKAMNEIMSLLKRYDIKSIFAYNASSEYERLSELSSFDWYDIMRVAAYKQHNPAITDDSECHESGRLLKDFGVAAMVRRLSKDKNHKETNNALYDARDELKILKLLNRPIKDYAFTKVSDIGDNNEEFTAAEVGPDALTTDEAEQLLGESRGAAVRLIKKGEIMGFKRGRRYFVSEVSVRDYIQRREAQENFRYKTTIMIISLAILFALLYLWQYSTKIIF